MSEPTLESMQVYGGSKYTNPPDHPYENEPEVITELSQERRQHLIYKLTDKYAESLWYESRNDLEAALVNDYESKLLEMTDESLANEACDNGLL